jgi:hypothetical protein
MRAVEMKPVHSTRSEYGWLVAGGDVAVYITHQQSTTRCATEQMHYSK